MTGEFTSQRRNRPPAALCERRPAVIDRRYSRGGITPARDAVLSVLEVLPFEPPADSIYASIRARLEDAGTPIGAHDMLIAAHALALGCTIVTGNEKEFARIRDLARENWLR